ncbi:bifunctional DedA family/phosphatase PAP2 family protein [Kushneria phyllosphaerae]|uniref:Inner membrane protein YabI n=1 Tax=Kushneria phyllosphaerae TaxID=2100822 RepID=A0A2R8CK26_9GAMM|nr:bifunctional DedA family/phosphatase PAP2 family protein [Kushneria phyllosphaerae]SPJ33250.1 Inner membrane protein YabI [Kushneria phyllosphaerae]
MHPVALIDQWAHNPTVLILIVGIVALLESLALIGLVMPGVVMLTAAASLAGHDQVSIIILMVSAFIGAVLGDGASYWLGRTQRDRLRGWWPFNRYPQWVDQGERFFTRHGALSVAFGRFVGPVRPIIPMVAGMMYMSPARFLTVNVISALLWAPAYLLPGYYLGRSWQRLVHLPAGTEQWLSVLMLMFVVLGFALSWLRRRMDRDSRFYRGLLMRARRHSATRRLWLSLRQRKIGGEIPLASIVLLLAGIVAFIGWTWLVAGLQQPLAMDVAARSFFSRPDNMALMRASTLLDRIGDAIGISAMLLPWLVWLLWRKRLAALIHWGGALALLAFSNTALKQWIGRARPDTPEHLIGSFSYPSAHASTAVVFWGLSAAFIAEGLSSRARRWPYWVAIVAASVVALSRLTFGVHWLSDLIGGALLGLIVCGATRISYHFFAHRYLAGAVHRRQLVLLTLASVVLVIARIVWLPAF